ncbi:S-layer homology domain-containing protein [Cytobacillus dafuensis]|uniref:S-layer homology domain-containing protein n=1 Tax=Cytobacillus dafuensis TaxID=1742359 RepID=A0A5B8Z8J6_CYTDA|nr:S-layer homology domain-containing protein [Cytobacillus dafuensis]QED49432.1 S-layer homology domain-containing protein [Cytobacillus dafuensis]
MRNLRKLGILTLSTGLSIGILAPGVSATSLVNKNHTNVQIAQAEKVVTKNELIKKFREFFPQFNYLNDSDFHMGSGHHFPGDDTIRYDLNFHKKVNGKQEYGYVSFVGDQLEIENFNYQPANAVDALFPAKVTKEKAKEVAKQFLKNFPNSGEYQLQDFDLYDYFPSTQILTEPISYPFSFVQTKNKVPISDQRIHITVLGNGVVSNFNRSTKDMGSQSFDDVTKALPENKIISKIKEDVSIDLQYKIDFDYQTGDRHVNLVYHPTSDVLSVHALSGEWQTANGFSAELPKEKKLELISAQPIGPKKTNFSLEEAKALAETLLKVDSNDIKLRIESINEEKNHNGQEIISIQYMYEYRNGGSGTNLELDKHTGDIIQYNDLKRDVLENKKGSHTISSKEALDQAVKYLKQYSPSYLHNYAMPLGEANFEDERGIYHFIFPRVENNILVNGDHIFVSVHADGSLNSLNVNRSDIKNWPSTDKVIPKEKAAAKFFEQLSLNLQYVKEGSGQNKDHYRLVYTPVFNKNPFNFLDANKGEWNSVVTKKNRQVISHPSAKEELNYLINAGILDIGDVKTFNPDAQITKGAAIEMITKSLTRIHDSFPGQKNKSQSFKNIPPEHPLYQVIERAVTLGILDKEKDTFNPAEHLTREELAVWYIRALQLDQAAKNQGIYQLKFADAKDVQPENIGFVALAHSLNLLSANKNNFNPDQKVTYAQLAVSNVRLAHEFYKKGIEIHYY